MSTREYTVQQIMLNQVICFRKAAIDQFLDGLCVLRFIELIVNFPEELEPLFLAAKAIHSTPSTSQLVTMLKLSDGCQDQLTFDMLRDYVKSLDQEGLLLKH